MEPLHFETGHDRGWLQLDAQQLGTDWLLVISNQKSHIGAVAVGEYDPVSGRASASVLTVAGHRDDIIAKAQAQNLAGLLKSRTCIVVGIHIDHPTEDDLRRLVLHADQLVHLLTEKIRARGG